MGRLREAVRYAKSDVAYVSARRAFGQVATWLICKTTVTRKRRESSALK